MLKPKETDVFYDMHFHNANEIVRGFKAPSIDEAVRRAAEYRRSSHMKSITVKVFNRDGCLLQDRYLDANSQIEPVANKACNGFFY